MSVPLPTLLALTGGGVAKRTVYTRRRKVIWARLQVMSCSPPEQKRSCRVSTPSLVSRKAQSSESAISEPDSSPDVDRSPSRQEQADIMTDGCPLSEIQGGSCMSISLPSLKSSGNHGVLFYTDSLLAGIPRPFPDKFRDEWDSNHVKMPCSERSVYPVSEPEKKDKTLQPRWKLIRQAFSKPVNNSCELEEAIMSYNTRYSKKWNFGSLHAYFNQVCELEESNKFFTEVLPQMLVLALELPHIVTHAVPLLKKQQDYSVSMTQQQVACLLANAFLCTFPVRNSTSFGSEYSKYPSINFNTLYSQDTSDEGISPARIGKLRCIHHYFKRVSSAMPDGVVTFSRRQAEFPAWEHSSAMFTKLHTCSGGTIEEHGIDMLQVDFANKYVGGGVLGYGCVQEEIRFLISPELIISRLFVEELDANEVLLVYGPETFSTYKGYGSTFEWGGDFVDCTARDSWARKKTTVVAMDAIHFRSTQAQFKVGLMRREINKAYVGFAPTATCQEVAGHRCMAVATGKWGCGAFRGNVQLKSLLQLMAASEVNRDVAFFTFGDRSLVKDLSTFHSFLVKSNCNVGQVWQILLAYRHKESGELFQYIIQELQKTLENQTGASTFSNT